MLERLREAKRAADASQAAGLCPVCDHQPHRDTPCDALGPGACPCRWQKSLNSDLERFAEAKDNFSQAMFDALPARLRRWLRLGGGA